MLKAGEGLACWRPRPIKPYSGQRGVVPGDVGTYSAEGGFKRIFNLWDDEELIGRLDDGCSFPLPPRNLAVDPDAIPKGFTITEGVDSREISPEVPAEERYAYPSALYLLATLSETDRFH